MTKHKKIKMNMRKSTLDSLMLAFLSSHAPTRMSVSEKCGVSKVTSGKAAKALVESRIMCEKVFSLNKESPCSHLFIDDELLVMIIDLSSPTFKMTLFDANAVSKFNSFHNYDDSMSFDENINIFLSRCGLKAKKSGFSFSAISVIYSDTSKHDLKINAQRRARLPSIEDCAIISDAIYSVFHKRSISHLTVSQAICEAVKFGEVEGVSGNEGVSYIRIGSNTSSFHIHANGSITVCSPQGILSDEEKYLLQNKHLITKENTDTILAHISKFMSCAFSPLIIILESEYHLPDESTARMLTRELTLAGVMQPIIRFKQNDTLFILGAVRHSVYALASKCLIP